MDRLAAPGPVVISPNSPIAPEVWSQAPAPSPSIDVRTAGGPTQINLFWESLLEASGHINSASVVFTQTRADLTGIFGTLSATTGHLHWNIPHFHAQLGLLLAGTAGTEELLRQTGQGAERAHQAYRDLETTVQRWFTLLLRISEHELVIEHLINPNGDSSFAYDWMITTGVVTGGLGLDVLGARFPRISTIIGTLSAMEKHAGLTPALMGRHEQVLDTTPTTEFSHAGDGSLNTHLQAMSQVSEHGDIAVSAIENDAGEEVYAVFIAGLDVDEINTENGRGPMSLVDAFGNDSEHMSAAVDQALQASGASEGATVLPIGFSMGGSHVINLVSNKALTQKYRFPAAATIGSPGKNTRVEPDVRLTHFEDGRDPVPHLLGERHQEATDRLSVIYDFNNPDSDVDTILGSAHTMQHNIDAIAAVEESPGKWLTADEAEHLDELRTHLNGRVDTTVYSTRWQPQENPDHLLPGEAENLEDLSYFKDAIEEASTEARSLVPRSMGWPDSASSPPPIAR